MADQLYLSVWFPDFELSRLPAAVTGVMRQFASISGDKHVAAASAYPISFSETATYQRIYVNDSRSEATTDALIEPAVAEATEQLHSDTAYEFEMRWKLWTPDADPGSTGDRGNPNEAQLDTLWRPEPATVRIIGFGPDFDESAYEQNGHVRVDFGLDYPWVLDDEADDEEETSDEDAKAPVTALARPPGSNIIPFRAADIRKADAAPASEAAQYIQRNVEMLLAFTLSVEKHCGISSRLLWTESGEPLAEKLIARLQRLN